MAAQALPIPEDKRSLGFNSNPVEPGRGEWEGRGQAPKSTYLPAASSALPHPNTHRPTRSCILLALLALLSLAILAPMPKLLELSMLAASERQALRQLQGALRQCQVQESAGVPEGRSQDIPHELAPGTDHASGSWPTTMTSQGVPQAGENAKTEILMGQTEPLQRLGVGGGEEEASEWARRCAPAACHSMQRTQSGLCAGQIFEAYDEDTRDKWPGGVDLLMRTTIGHDMYKLLAFFLSVDLFWPKTIGDVVVVLDQGQQEVAALLPERIKVFYETNYLNLPGKLLQQWSYHWADNYTAAPYVSIIDDDVIFAAKVTPSLLFNLSEAKPYLLGISADAPGERQQALWEPSTKFFIGEGHFWGNFMVNLPFTFPRAVLPRFREHVARTHKGSTFDQAMKWWSEQKEKPNDWSKITIAHTVLGNYIRAFESEHVQVVRENSGHIPIPRVGIHLSYSRHLRPLRSKRMEFQRLYALYVGRYTTDALCAAFPQGELLGCPRNSSVVEDRVLWTYQYEWTDWEQLYKDPTPSATAVYDNYIQDMHSRYQKMKNECKSYGNVRSTQP